MLKIFTEYFPALITNSVLRVYMQGGLKDKLYCIQRQYSSATVFFSQDSDQLLLESHCHSRGDDCLLSWSLSNTGLSLYVTPQFQTPIF